MAATTTPPSIELLAALPPGGAGRRWAVACSGGRDSMALLHASLHQAVKEGGSVVALHVHHGLNPKADAWLGLVQGQCAQWAAAGLPVSLKWHHLALSPVAGQSVEALARDARYDALARMAHEAACDTVLLAHHRQDQAETFLLQALRGAGVAGLAAMAPAVQRGAIHWLRPWLGQPRARIEHYVLQHAVPYVDDDSNSDPRFARNRLRLAVWPVLREAFGDAEQGLSQAASHQADVLACLQDWLALRLPEVTRPQAIGADGDVADEMGTALDVAAWALHPEGLRRELLRGWFRQCAGRALPASWTHRLQRELLTGGGRRWPLELQGHVAGRPGTEGYLALYRGLLTWRPRRAASACSSSEAPADGLTGARLCVAEPGAVPLPGGWGTLMVEPVARDGVPLSWLRDCCLTPRRGGERFQMAANRPARSLKKQFQMLGVPAWAREGPLLWARDQLVFVPGLGVDARAWGQEGEVMVRLRWVPGRRAGPNEAHGSDATI